MSSLRRRALEVGNLVIGLFDIAWTGGHVEVMKDLKGVKYKILFGGRRPSYVDGVASLLGSDKLDNKYRWYLTTSDKEIDDQSIFDDWRTVGDDILNAMSVYEQKRSANVGEGIRSQQIASR